MSRFTINCLRRKTVIILSAGVVMTQLSEGALVYFQNFDTFDDANNTLIYFEADSDYDGIAGPDKGARTSAPNANLNGLLDTSTSGIPAAQSGSHFLYSATGGLGLEAGVLWSTNESQVVSVTVGTIYEFSFWMAGNSTNNPASIIPFINGVGLQNVTVDGIENPGIATYSQTGWTKHTYRWMADTATADLGLYSAGVETTGNDFGIDTIQFNSIPEPTSAVLVFAFGSSLFLVRRRTR